MHCAVQCTNNVEKNHDKPIMYFEQMYINKLSPHMQIWVEEDPQIITHRKFKHYIFSHSLTFLKNFFPQGSEQRSVCAWNHSSDAPRQQAGGTIKTMTRFKSCSKQVLFFNFYFPNYL